MSLKLINEPALELTHQQRVERILTVAAALQKAIDDAAELRRRLRDLYAETRAFLDELDPPRARRARKRR